MTEKKKSWREKLENTRKTAKEKSLPKVVKAEGNRVSSGKTIQQKESPSEGTPLI
jgi:hypothetical protein